MTLTQARSICGAATVTAVFALLCAGGAARADSYDVVNLVSNGSVPAKFVDPKLGNAWGISYGPGGPFWVSDNNTGLTTLYNTSGAPQSLVVTIAPPAGSPSGFVSAPTGQVFNSTSGFKVTSNGKTGKASFIFDTEDGTISGWSPSVNAGSSVLAVDNSQKGAVYKGLALGTVGGNSFLYATNFESGEVEMYNSSFQLAGQFTDPTVAAGYAPFNAAVLDGKLYVTFALQDAAKHDDVAGLGNGYVDVFNLDGSFDTRLISGGVLDSPWGLDIAPTGFGKYADDLLVGNFGNGEINAFNPTTGQFLGTLLGSNGQPIVEGSLWGLINGNGGAGGNLNSVYFSSGVADEAGGLFGSLSVPEPSTWAMMILGVAAVGICARRRPRPASSSFA